MLADVRDMTCVSLRAAVKGWGDIAPGPGGGGGGGRDVLEGGGEGVSEGGGGVFGWGPSFEGPPMVPAEGGLKKFEA